MDILSQAVFTTQDTICAAGTSAAIFTATLGLARLFGPHLLSASARYGVPAQLREVAAPAATQKKQALEQLRSFFSTSFRGAPEMPSSIPLFTYMELFAGIGGFSVAAEKLGGHCLFASELAHATAKTWNLNFGVPQKLSKVPHEASSTTPAVVSQPWRPQPSPMMVGDIRRVTDDMFPGSVDLLVGGFPCQPFSRSGAQPGTECPKSGDLYLSIIRALKRARPKVFLLENVPGLECAEEGDALRQIVASLREAGYDLALGVIESSSVLPHKRQRLYFCGFRRGDPSVDARRFAWPQLPDVKRAFNEIVELDAGLCKKFCLLPEQWKKKLEITDGETWRWFVKMDVPGPTLTRSYRRGPGVQAGKRFLMVGRPKLEPGAAAAAASSAAAAADKEDDDDDGVDDDEGDDENDVDDQQPAAAAAAAAANDADGDAAYTEQRQKIVSKRGWWKFVPVPGSNEPRFFTHREAARLQGFSETFAFPQENTGHGPATAQCGNAVSCPVIFSILQPLLVAGGVPCLYRGEAGSRRSARAGLNEMLLDAVPQRTVAPLRHSLGTAPLVDRVKSTRLFIAGDDADDVAQE